MLQSLEGGCLCGLVRYQLEGRLEFVANCHCSICRRSHGASMASQAVIWDPTLHWISGFEELTTYQATLGYHRSFCSRCGSRLINYPDNMAFVSLSINSVDNLQEGLLPSMHVYVGSKPSLFSICDSLPQYALLPSGSD
jgi:hypothetical protein